MVDISRQTAGVLLPPVISGTIWQTVQEQSAVAALSTPMTLPAGGSIVEIITGDPTPEWVHETDEKPVSRGSVSSKTMQGYTLAVIVPFSNQFRRDKDALFNAMVQRLPGVMARKIDQTILYGTAPGSNFDVLSDADTFDLGTPANVYDELVDLEAAINVAYGELTGFALSAQGVAALRKVKDGMGNPLLSTVEGGLTNVLGYPVRRSRAVYDHPATGADIVGFAGDFSKATFGTVQGITVDYSSEATINDNGTQLNLWQRNMFAVRVEMEIGFRVRDKALFRRLTGARAAGDVQPAKADSKS